MECEAVFGFLKLKASKKAALIQLIVNMVEKKQHKNKQEVCMGNERRVENI